MSMLGACVHPTWNTTAYNNVAQCFAALDRLGMTFVRGCNATDSMAGTWCSALRTRGMGIIVTGSEQTVPDATWLTALENLVTTYPGVVIALEGRNEPDVFWNVGGDPYSGSPRATHMTDRQVGDQWYDYSLRYQQAVWNLSRGSSVAAVRNLPVLAAPIGHTETAQVWTDMQAHSLSGYCTVANCHYYPGNGAPSQATIDTFFSRTRTYADCPEVWVTETGYAQNVTSDATAAGWFPTLLDCMNGAMRVSIYQLFNDDPVTVEQRGLVASNFTIKQVGTAVQNYRARHKIGRKRGVSN